MMMIFTFPIILSLHLYNVSLSCLPFLMFHLLLMASVLKADLILIYHNGKECLRMLMPWQGVHKWFFWCFVEKVVQLGCILSPYIPSLTSNHIFNPYLPQRQIENFLSTIFNIMHIWHSTQWKHIRETLILRHQVVFVMKYAIIHFPEDGPVTWMCVEGQHFQEYFLWLWIKRQNFYYQKRSTAGQGK